jgi:hypothetical protein
MRESDTPNDIWLEHDSGRDAKTAREDGSAMKAMFYEVLDA